VIRSVSMMDTFSKSRSLRKTLQWDSPYEWGSVGIVANQPAFLPERLTLMRL